MSAPSGKRVALNRLTLTVRSVDALKPTERSWIAWDDRLTGFGVRVQPTGLKSFIVNYRAGDGGRKAPNRRVVLGRHGDMSVTEARGKARRMLAAAARGEDPAGRRRQQRSMPVLERAFEDFMGVNPGRAAGTERLYREEFARHFADWRERPLDDITRRDVEALFIRLTEDSGWSPANRAVSAVALDLSQAVRRFQGPAQPGRPMARGRRQISPQQAAQDLHPGGGPAALEEGHRGCGGHAVCARCLLVRPLHPACGCARCWPYAGEAWIWRRWSSASRRPRRARRWSFP